MLTLSECLDDEREVYEGDEHHVEFIEAGENPSKSLEATE
ncbi:unnamed protein product [marine sediment metagenome]|uniref:Uncharacterized protein n=1 Tax=marine sediment metagenome TaxID=412755 RepID=X0Z9S9_9ZZZZ